MNGEDGEDGEDGERAMRWKDPIVPEEYEEVGSKQKIELAVIVLNAKLHLIAVD